MIYPMGYEDGQRSIQWLGLDWVDEVEMSYVCFPIHLGYKGYG